MTVKNLYRLPDAIRHPKKRALLKAIAECFGVRRACAVAGVHHSTYYEWRLADPTFADAANEAREHYIEWLEAVADERATRGRRPSDTMLIFRLKALRPEVYRERQEITLTRQERESRIAELLGKRGGTLPATNGHANGDGHVQHSGNSGGGSCADEGIK